MGLYITSIEAQNSSTYIVNGKAFSDAKTAAFMNAIPGQLFSTPELLNIKRVNNVQEFSIRIPLNSNIGQPYDMTQANQNTNPISTDTADQNESASDAAAASN